MNAIQLFDFVGGLVATINAPYNADVILFHGRTFVLRNGAFREAVICFDPEPTEA